MNPMTIWCNGKFEEAVLKRLREGAGAHTLVVSAAAKASVLAAGSPDPALLEAEIAFGQPAPADCIRSTRLKWAQLTSAGYTRYDTGELRENFRGKGAALTTSSGVFADPCAQHLLAMMMALNRDLLGAYREQTTERGWRHKAQRQNSRLLTGSTVVLLGFGAIGRRLAHLLAPFACTVYAVRRQTRSEPGVRIVPEEDLTKVLALADHVVNILPENDSTANWVNARRLACFKQGARFYNVGRGTTVDQNALIEALQSKRLGAAYLDVMVPEPLPPESPLWVAPNCYITPHSAGGRTDEQDALVTHFLANLAAFEGGRPMADRVA
jgi:phosphoglycerate dehydrogenase-like enzyme